MASCKTLLVGIVLYISRTSTTTSSANSSLLRGVEKHTESASDKQLSNGVMCTESKHTDDKVRFFIFTHPGMMERIGIGSVSAETLTNNLVPGKPIVLLLLLVHGYRGSCSEPNFPGLLVQAYFKEGRSENILCVDWQQLAFHGKRLNMFEYWQARDSGLVVAQKLKEFIKLLVDGDGVRSLSDVHIIGYSVGAHIAGTAAALIQKDLGIKIGRVTGLDPALPLYNF